MPPVASISARPAAIYAARTAASPVSTCRVLQLSQNCLSAMISAMHNSARGGRLKRGDRAIERKARRRYSTFPTPGLPGEGKDKKKKTSRPPITCYPHNLNSHPSTIAKLLCLLRSPFASIQPIPHFVRCMQSYPFSIRPLRCILVPQPSSTL